MSVHFAVPAVLLPLWIAGDTRAHRAGSFPVRSS